MKRIFDLTFSLIGLIILIIPLSILMLIIWLTDYYSPLYISFRVGIRGKKFKMFKLRSMIPNADKSGVNSTSLDDDRITWIGKVIRKYKFDEVMQLLNVFLGDMSFVGPRPNVIDETLTYTQREKTLFDVKPGITDFSSIVFSDEGDILKGSPDPDLDYNQLIRPWKSRLGIIYIENQSFLLDIQIIIYTLIALISKKASLNWICRKLNEFDVNPRLIRVAYRKENLYAYPPPGSSEIIE